MRWLYRDFPAAWFGLLHRTLGLILLVSFCPLLVDGHRLFGAEGLFDPALLQLHPHAFGYSIYSLTAAIAKLCGLHPDEVLVLLMCVYLFGCMALITGVAIRLTALALIFLHHAFFVAVPLFSYGFDYLALSALAYCAAYTKRWATPLLRCMQLHLCLVYFFGGFNKVLGATWHDGEALWKAVQQPTGQILLPVPTSLRAYPLVWTIAGWGIVLLELAYVALIWWRPTRRVVLPGVVLMHVGIAVMMGLYAFSALMVLLNLVAFHYPYLHSLTHPTDTPPTEASGAPVRSVPLTGGTPTNQLSSFHDGLPPDRPP